MASGSKAFPYAAVLSVGLIQHRAGTEPVLVVVGPDGRSIRAFRTAPDATFFRDDPERGLMTGAATSSSWNLSRLAIEGPLAGQSPQPIDRSIRPNASA